MQYTALHRTLEYYQDKKGGRSDIVSSEKPECVSEPKWETLNSCSALVILKGCWGRNVEDGRPKPYPVPFPEPLQMPKSANNKIVRSWHIRPSKRTQSCALVMFGWFLRAENYTIQFFSQNQKLLFSALRRSPQPDVPWVCSPKVPV